MGHGSTKDSLVGVFVGEKQEQGATNPWLGCTTWRVCQAIFRLASARYWSAALGQLVGCRFQWIWTSSRINRGVAGDDEIAVGDHGGGLHKVPRLADLVLTANKATAKRAICQLLGAITLLQKQQTGVRLLDDRNTQPGEKFSRSKNVAHELQDVSQSLFTHKNQRSSFGEPAPLSSRQIPGDVGFSSS